MSKIRHNNVISC